MTLRIVWIFCFAVAGGALAAACSGSDDADGPSSFAPSTFDTSCTVDTDCGLFVPITDCYSCCSPVAAKASDEIRAARSAVQCEEWSMCAMKCPNTTAACISGKCEVMKPDGG